MNCKICSNNLKEKKLSEIDDFYNENDKIYTCPLCETEYTLFENELKMIKKGRIAKEKNKANIIAISSYILFVLLMIIINSNARSTELSIIILSILIPSFIPIKTIVYRLKLGESYTEKFINLNVFEAIFKSLGWSLGMCIIVILPIGPLDTIPYKVQGTEIVTQNINLVSSTYENGTKYYFKHDEDNSGKYYSAKYINNNGVVQDLNIHDKDINKMEYATEPSVNITKEIYYGERVYPKWAETLYFIKNEKKILDEKTINYDIIASNDMILE